MCLCKKSGFSKKIKLDLLKRVLKQKEETLSCGSNSKWYINVN
ncbi:LOW QUALITY PROTEIN: hypothetical protein TorRG33x02_316740 [Trema orientale]|uniref:Uncharacterized protein n=1 Tax=Trema orientale TaxID=63057 RepID=A0A2P5BLI0_TREOI|nr:LOW QUALITY PROTEIN: hypothetical protein TorRG33x02_316740 [Trema orientale]